MPSGVGKELEPFKTKATELIIETDCLLWETRVIILSKLQGSILRELHVTHTGVSQMKSIAQSQVWWPGLDRISRSCLACVIVKHTPTSAPLHPWIWLAKPWQKISVDFASPFLGKTFVIIVDAHPKLPEVYEMSTTRAFIPIWPYQHSTKEATHSTMAGHDSYLLCVLSSRARKSEVHKRYSALCVAGYLQAGINFK